MTDLIRRKQSGEAWETAVDTGGGSGPDTQSQEVTTDPDTFTSENFEFDLGAGPHVIAITFEAISFDPDGETPGADPGQISVECATVSGVFETSNDGVNWHAGSVAFQIQLPDPPGNRGSDILLGAGDTILYPAYCLRYIRGHIEIWDTFGGQIYSGSNHPTATVTVTVESSV